MHLCWRKLPLPNPEVSATLQFCSHVQNFACQSMSVSLLFVALATVPIRPLLVGDVVWGVIRQQAPDITIWFLLGTSCLNM